MQKENSQEKQQPSFQNIDSDFEKEFFYSNKTYIHPTSIIGPNVILDENVKIGPFCTLIGNIKIGSGTRLSSNVSIGFPAQDTGTKESLGNIEIGKNCEIKEFVTIHASKNLDGKTKIGNNCYLMNFSHVAHDVTTEENVILINNVNLGGHAYVEKNVMLMANSAVHQFCRIGKFSCLAPFSATRQDLPPFCTLTGQPAQFAGLNLISLKRSNMSTEDIRSLKHVTKLYYQDKLLLADIIKSAEKNIESWGCNKHVLEFINFIQNSKRGVSRRTFSYKDNL